MGRPHASKSPDEVRERQREKRRAYYAQNKERINKRARELRAMDRENFNQKCRERRKRYNAEHPDRPKKVCFADNPDREAIEQIIREEKEAADRAGQL